MGSLAGQYISQSYQSLIHLGSDSTISSSYTDLQDGFGNSLKVSVNAQGDISASGNIYAANLSALTYDTGSLLTTASVNVNVLTFTKGNGSTFNLSVTSSVPAGTVSGSSQIAALGFISSSVTSSMAVSSSLYAVTASLAREVIVSAINANQSTLPIGTVVRISGANGDNPQFNTASYTDETNSSNTLGILANTAVSGLYADVTVIGRVIGVNTQGMNAGDLLYLSSSGQFTNVAPQAPLQIVTLGEVLRVQQNNGSIFVNVSNGWELNELHNVRIVNPLQGDVLVYEASSSLWKNVPSSSITPTDISALNTFTASIAGTNTFTASVAGTNAFTASIAGTNAFTASANQRLTAIESVSGSWITESETGSFATTGSNNFVGNQSITGSLIVSGSESNDVQIYGNLRVYTDTVNAFDGASTFGNIYVGTGNIGINTNYGLDWTAGPKLNTAGTQMLITASVFDISGSLNVNGNTRLSGSLSIQSGSSFPQGTGSALLAYNQTTGQVTYTSYQSALPALFDVGAFYSTVTQSGSANVSGSFTFDNTVPINSINITSGSHINLANIDVAYYNIQCRIQAQQGSGEGNVAVWLKKNGANVPNTATYTTIASNQKKIIALNVWDSGSVGDYFQLAYQSDSANTTYQYIAATGNIPASPSIVLTINQVR